MAISALVVAGALSPPVHGGVNHAEPTPDPAELDLAFHFERGGFDFFSDFLVQSDNDIWGVTRNGTAHFDGSSWRLVGTYGEIEWLAADARSRRGWAAGSHCSVLRFDDGVWTLDQLDCSGHFEAVAIAPSGAAWAGGAEHTGDNWISVMYYHDCAEWFRVDVPEGAGIRAIKAFSDSSALAVDGAGILRWDGTEWRREEIPVIGHPLHDIDGVAADDVWVVGGAGSLEGGPAETVLHYNGDTWTVVRDHEESGDYLLRRVKMVSATEGWAVGEWGIIERFDGERWNKVALTGVARYGLTAVGVVGPNHAWFGGNGGQLVMWKDDQTFLPGGFRQNGAWEPIASISLLPDGTGWAAGAMGPLLRREGGRWSEFNPMPFYDGYYRDHPSVTVVEAVGPTEAWAAGARPGTVRHYVEAEWIGLRAPTLYPIVDISVVTKDDVWAIGSAYDDEGRRIGGDILHYDGHEWRLVYRPRNDTALWAIDMTAADQGWAVGNRLLHFDKGVWTEQGVAGTLYGVSFVSTDIGWAFGWYDDYQVLLGYCEGEWYSIELRLERGEYLSGIATAPDGTAWMTTNRERLLRYDGESLSTAKVPSIRAPSGNHYAFRGICIVPTADLYDVWIGGDFDTIVRVSVSRTPRSSPTPPKPQWGVFLPVIWTP